MGAATAVFLLSSGISWAASVPSELGVDDPQAQQMVDSAVRGGFVSIYIARNVLKAADGAQRARLVGQALAWAKAYTETPEFAAAYERAREAGKPQPPEPKPSVEEELKQQRAEQKKQIEQMKNSAASLPADQRKILEDTAEQMMAQMAAMERDQEMVEIQKKVAQLVREQEQKQYEEATKRWLEGNPPDPRPLIAQRLRKFLDTCADVDFDANLVAHGSQMRFAEQRYERKPPEWKLCFRAGRDAVGAARTFATTWLTELEAK